MHREGDTPIRQFQVFGERASGTNVVRKTLQKNVDCMRVETLGWKHGFLHMVAIPADLVTIGVVRHAWNWARSLYARPWHAHPDMQLLPFDAFIRAPWHSIVDRPTDFEMLHDELDAEGAALQLDRHPMTGAQFENIFALRRAKLESLLSLAKRGNSCAFVRMESFNDSQKEFCAEFAGSFDLSWQSDRFKRVEWRMGNRFNPSVGDRPPSPEVPSAEDLAFMRSQLDLNCEAQLGYSYDEGDC